MRSFFSYYKNAATPTTGWNAEVIAWCKKEADRLGLKAEDRWSGLVLDKMTIQVRCKTQLHFELSEDNLFGHFKKQGYLGNSIFLAIITRLKARYNH